MGKKNYVIESFILILFVMLALVRPANALIPPINTLPISSLPLPGESASPESDFSFTVADGKAIITYYKGTDSSVVIPSKLGGYPVTVIGNNAFYYKSSLKSVVIPEGVTELKMGALGFNENLQSVTLPNSLSVIGEDAFINAKSLTSIRLPEGLTCLVQGAFYGTGLTSITIPKKVSFIDDYVFQGSPKLASIAVDADNPTYASSDGVLYNKNFTRLVSYPPAKTNTNHTVLSTVKEIGVGAFSSNTYLTQITIPNSVTAIMGSAFSKCSSLKSIIIPSSVTKLGSGVFYNCKSLTQVTLPDTIIDIERQTFQGCISLTSITLPSNLKTISPGLFSQCYNLKSIDIPAKVTVIGDAAFLECINLGSVKLPPSLQTIGFNAFIGCKSLQSITLPATVTKIDGQAFKDCSNLTSVTIPVGVSEIGNSAFRDCNNLKQARFLGNAPKIGSVAFYQASKGFIIYYINGKAGWTTPLWNSYPTKGVSGFGILQTIALRPITTLPLPERDEPLLLRPKLPDLSDLLVVPTDEVTENTNLNVETQTPQEISTSLKAHAKLKLYLGKSNYLINGTNATMDTKPLVIDNRILLPIRYIVLPSFAETKWDAKAQQITITTGKIVLKLRLGSNSAEVNGVRKLIDPSNPKVKPVSVPPGRIMMPLRFIGENLSCKVQWDSLTKSINIVYLDPQPEPPAPLH